MSIPDLDTELGERTQLGDRSVVAVLQVEQTLAAKETMLEYARCQARAIVAFHDTLRDGGISLELRERLTIMFHDQKPEFKFSMAPKLSDV